MDVPHGLDARATNRDVLRPELTVIILAGGDGRGVLHYLDDHVGSVNGLIVVRIFTQDSPSPTLRKRGIPITSLADAPWALDRLPEEELARLAVRELATFVFLVNWTESLGISFLQGLGLTLDLGQPRGLGATIVRFDTQVAVPGDSAPSEHKLRHTSTLLFCGSDGEGGLIEQRHICLEFDSLPLDAEDEAMRDHVTASMERDAAVAVMDHFLPQYTPDQPTPHSDDVARAE
ncbi:hypothetical protein AURDEDRAFT_157255 [Auricularia subglabra TFB-10046 SS5]|nr:hypothetical protein AURDEDRAFT_157255 [Auricularia subglabra TFB-10046 SS5]